MLSRKREELEFDLESSSDAVWGDVMCSAALKDWEGDVPWGRSSVGRGRGGGRGRRKRVGGGEG